MNKGLFPIDFAQASEGQIGSKGENLRSLMNMGVEIPKTFCLTSEGYEFYLDKSKLRDPIGKIVSNDRLRGPEKARKINELFLSHPLPEEVSSAFSGQAFSRLANSKMAVRSSSNQEDLSNASFAGLYDTFLNVEGIENLLDGVKRCWASLWSERAIRYREGRGLSHSQATMAVLIQEMVPAVYSGVLFTADPITQEGKQMLLEYCFGLGDQLVSGRITPFSSVIDKSSMTIRRLNRPKDKDLSGEEILTLARIAVEIEKRFNGPQDIEWAFDGKKFYILQTRPISASKEDEKIRLGEIWTRANVGEVLPDAVTPLTWSVFCASLLRQASPAGENRGDNIIKPSEGIDLIQGRVYIRIDKFLDSFCYLPFVDPPILERALGVILPPGAEKYIAPQGLKVRLAQGVFLINALRFWPRISNLIKSLPALPGESVSEVREIISWTSRWFEAHLKSTAYAMGAFGIITHLLERWLIEEKESLLTRILIGDSTLQTAAQGISLRYLSQFVRGKPELKVFFQTGPAGGEILEKIHFAPGGSEFIKLFTEFLDENGARTAGEFELAIPRWREDPSFPLEVVRRFLQDESPEDSKVDPEKRRQNRKKTLAEIRKSLKPWQKWLLDRLLVSYSEFSTLRENVKYRLMEGFGLLRQYFLRVGDELVERKILSIKEDVFFLTFREIEEIRFGKGSNCRVEDLIASRRGEWTIWQSNSAPDLIDRSHPLWRNNRGSNLRGIGCSPGIAEGVARVLFDTSHIDDVIPGEILVAPHTDPGWTPLFLVCKGLVTETGGFLSHGATVAREYGVPAVVSVAGATEKIQTGDLLRVDGGNGLVTICRRNGVNSPSGEGI